MASKWYFECAPCKMAQPFDTQDDAVAAAEKHAATDHPGVRGKQAVDQRIATVRNRDENEFAAPAETAQVPEAGQES